jgi:tetratricopeptide (TPR) repeat protein
MITKTGVLILLLHLLFPAHAELEELLTDPIPVFRLEQVVSHIEDHLSAGRFADATQPLVRLKEEKIRTTDGYSAYDVIVEVLSETVQEDDIKAWIASDPENSIPYSVMGEWYINEAWKRRGGGYAHKVKEEGWRGFSHYLTLARQHLEKAYALDPGDYVACAHMITVCMGQSDKAGCYTWFDRAVALDPEYYSAHNKLIWAMYPRWLGSEKEVQALLKSLEGRDPKFNKIITSRMRRTRKSDYKDPSSEIGKEAYRLLRAHVEAYPQSGGARGRLGDLLWWQGARARAVRHYEAAAQLDPSFSNLYEYANLLYLTKQYGLATKVVEDAIAANPDNYKGYSLAGRIHQFGYKQYSDAVAFYTQALDRNPRLRATVRWRGECFMQLEEVEKALEDFKRAVELNSKSDWAFFRLG